MSENIELTTNPEPVPVPASRPRDSDQASPVLSRTSSRQPNLDNPLLDYTPGELDEAVSEFARNHNLKHACRLLQHGAHLARDKASAMYQMDQDGQLSPEERTALENEEEHGFWKQSKYLKAAMLASTLAAMIQGWTQSNSNASNAGWPAKFGLNVTLPDRRTGDLWLLGLLNSSFFWGGGLLGTSVADPLQEHFLGRRGAVFVATILTLIATVGAACSRTLWQLFGCRLVIGVGIGVKASAIPIYTAELAPNHIRGALGVNWQQADALGIFAGFACNLIIFSITANKNLAWRLQTATALIPTVWLLLILFLVPESPRFFMKHGKYPEALAAFNLLRAGPAGPLIAARDMYYAHVQLEVESRIIAEGRASGQAPGSGRHSRGGRGDNLGDMADAENLAEQTFPYQIREISYWQRFRQLFTVPRCRRATLCAAIVMMARQLTGINTIALLSTLLFKELNHGKPNHNSDLQDSWINLVVGAVNYLSGLPAYRLIESIGRSILLLIGLPNMAWLMLVLAFCFKIKDDSNAKMPLVVIFMALFVIAYSPTAGTSPYTISAEVFPLVNREAGHALAVTVNMIFAGLLLLTFPRLRDKTGNTASLSIFPFLNVVSFVLCFLFVPETKGRTIEELQYTFDQPTKRHIKYRTRYVLPYFWKRYILFKEENPPIPFYWWARATVAS